MFSLKIDDPELRGIAIQILEYERERARLETVRIKQEIEFRVIEHEKWLANQELTRQNLSGNKEEPK